MKHSSSGASGRPGSHEPASRAPGGSNDPAESSSPKAGTLRSLRVIEEHTMRVARAVEHGLPEGDAVSALARLRREVAELQDQLVKARLEHFLGSTDAAQRATAAELLDLLESRHRTDLPKARVIPATVGRKGEGR